MLYSPKEQAKRTRWKKYWLKQMLLADSAYKISRLRKTNAQKRLRKAC